MNKPRRTHKPKLSNNNDAFVPRVVAAAMSPIQAKKTVKITQDGDDDNDTLAPTTLDLYADDWDDGEDEETAQPQPRISPCLSRINFMCQRIQSAYPNRYYIPSQRMHSYKSYKGE